MQIHQFENQTNKPDERISRRINLSQNRRRSKIRLITSNSILAVLDGMQALIVLVCKERRTQYTLQKTYSTFLLRSKIAEVQVSLVIHIFHMKDARWEAKYRVFAR
jgi:hypothetical protein